MRTKSELRFIATAIAVATFLTTGAAQASPATSLPNPSIVLAHRATANFLTAKFVNGAYLEGFTPGKPDFGFTLEALLQRFAAGQSAKQLATAEKYSLIRSDITGTPKSKTGYLYSSEGTLIPGLAAKFIFTSEALGVKNSVLRNSISRSLEASVATSGLVANANPGAFDYGWVTLAMAAIESDAKGKAVGQKLLSFQHADGGFGPDSNGAAQVSGTDSTGIALQALSTVRSTRSVSFNSRVKAAISRAAGFLKASATGTPKSHWDAWGDYDSNGSSYAIMGLQSVGQNVSVYRRWLATKVAKDGGLVVSWTEQASKECLAGGGSAAECLLSGDSYATAQGYLALVGSSYAQLIK